MNLKPMVSAKCAIWWAMFRGRALTWRRYMIWQWNISQSELIFGFMQNKQKVCRICVILQDQFLHRSLYWLSKRGCWLGRGDYDMASYFIGKVARVLVRTAPWVIDQCCESKVSWLLSNMCDVFLRVFQYPTSRQKCVDVLSQVSFVSVKSE